MVPVEALWGAMRQKPLGTDARVASIESVSQLPPTPRHYSTRSSARPTS